MASLSSRLRGGGDRGDRGDRGGRDAPTSPPSSSAYDNSKQKRGPPPGHDPASRSKATRAFLFLVGVLLTLGIIAARQRPKPPAWLPRIFRRRERVAVLTVASYQPRKPLGEAAADARDDIEYVHVPTSLPPRHAHLGCRRPPPARRAPMRRRVLRR